MSSYKEKLKHPRWQKKRLGIFERDGYKCRLCESSEDTLHVHHLVYKEGVDPWDYPDAGLMTLCNACHENQHVMATSVRREFLDSFMKHGAHYHNISEINDYISDAVTIEGAEEFCFSENDLLNLPGVFHHLFRFIFNGGDLRELSRVISQCTAISLESAHV